MLPKEYNWFLRNPEIETKYAGEYVAIIGESVVAHGRDLKVPSSDKELIV